jgi:hypothetical protein
VPDIAFAYAPNVGSSGILRITSGLDDDDLAPGWKLVELDAFACRLVELDACCKVVGRDPMVELLAKVLPVTQSPLPLTSACCVVNAGVDADTEEGRRR